jgi:putative holliday junction resolvase
MKYLGIDYGTKKVGIAISDDLGKIAFPKKIVASTYIYTELQTLINSENIEALVVGESKSFDGEFNIIQKHIDVFVRKMKSLCDIPILFEDERMSSLAGSGYLYSKNNSENPRWSGSLSESRNAPDDDRAAAVILQRFLDRKNRSLV